MTYIYNPDCACAWCQNNGTIPAGTASDGHSFGYENPHIPPSVAPWTHIRVRNPRPNRTAQPAPQAEQRRAA